MITAILIVSTMWFGGSNFQDRYDLCQNSANIDHPACEIFYERECICEVKSCKKVLKESPISFED